MATLPGVVMSTTSTTTFGSNNTNSYQHPQNAPAPNDQQNARNNNQNNAQSFRSSEITSQQKHQQLQSSSPVPVISSSSGSKSNQSYMNPYKSSSGQLHHSSSSLSSNMQVDSPAPPSPSFVASASMPNANNMPSSPPYMPMDAERTNFNNPHTDSNANTSTVNSINQNNAGKSNKNGMNSGTSTNASTTTALSTEGTSSSETQERSSGLNKNRRQKRLERNRESARLSRRRRKQYLEVLEERVSQLSDEMDKGRRQHAAQAVSVVQSKRSAQVNALLKSGGGHFPQPHQQFSNGLTQTVSSMLSSPALLRTSSELKVAATFCAKQLQSFCAPPAHKFVLWLTLQPDDFFRGGRAASERLSAARIGERMLQNGTDRVTPAQTMWPLFCNEVGLSYDQEEKVRNYQRSILQVPETWLSRHGALAGSSTMSTAHEVTQAMALSIGNRERRLSSILTDVQKAKLAAYMAASKQQQEQKDPGSNFSSLSSLQRLRSAKPKIFGENLMTPFSQKQHLSESDANKEETDKNYELSQSQHVAANLYILNYRLSKILQRVPSAAPMVTGTALKKLSRRPSFESLGARSGEKSSDNGDAPSPTTFNSGAMVSSSSNSSLSRPLSRDSTNTSCGSLKRSASEMSVDDSNDERHSSHKPSIDPIGAQACAANVVEKALGHVKEIIPAGPNGKLYQHQQGHQQRPDASASGFFMDDLDVDPDLLRLNGEPLPDPVPVAVMSSKPAPPSYMVPLAPPAESSNRSSPFFLQPQYQNQFASIASTNNSFHFNEPDTKQRRSASSGCLGVVPEEVWSSEAADDFLMSFVEDEDWAIGGGIETDM